MIQKWLVDKVGGIIETAWRTGAIVSAWEEIKDVLLKEKLAWIEQIPPEFVATHMRNRSGEGVGAIQSHSHGNDVIQQGWSWHKAADAVAVEYTGDDETKQFNDELVALSDDMFPVFVLIKVLSISASHTNAFLRAVKAGCKSGCPELTDAGGKLNMEEICLNRPELRKAIQDGLRWCVLSDAAVSQWPDLIDLVQKSMNTQARESQSEVEVMMSMFQQAQAQGSQVNWTEIENAAKFPNPPCKAWVPALALFVREYCGAGELLQDLNMFSRALGGLKDQKAAGSKKILGSEFWQKLNSLSWGPGKKMPWVMNGTIKANLASPPNKVVDGFCKLVEARHIAQLLHKSNKTLVEEAEALMTDTRAVVKQLGLTSVESRRVVNQMDVRCILHILKLGKVGEGITFDSISDIAQAPTHTYVLVFMRLQCLHVLSCDAAASSMLC